MKKKKESEIFFPPSVIGRLEDLGRLAAGLEQLLKSDFLCTTDPSEFKKRYENIENYLLHFYKVSQFLKSGIGDLLDIALPEEERLYPLKIAYLDQRKFFRDFGKELEQQFKDLAM